MQNTKETKNSTADTTARRTEPRQERAQQTVARIKRTMLAIVAEHGYVAATTNRIAEEAHVNIATVYHYFPNQHDQRHNEQMRKRQTHHIIYS